MPDRIRYHRPGNAADASRAYEVGEDRMEAKRFYAQPRWRRLRAMKVRANPLCEDCERRGLLTPAEQVHHKEERRDRPDLAFDWENLESVCLACHNGKRKRAEP